MSQNNIVLQQFIDEMPIGFAKLKVFFDENQRPVDFEYLYVNQTFEHITKTTADQLIGLRLSDLATGNSTIANWAKTGLANLDTPRSKPFTHFEAQDDKTYKIRLSDAEPGCVFAMIFDITEEIKREQESRKAADSMANFYEFFNTVYDMLFILDDQGNIIHANKTVFDRLGYTEDELYGKTVLNVHPLERRDEALINVMEMLQGKREYCPVPVIDKAGHTIAVETRVRNGHWDGKPVLFGVVKDISELKASEEKFSKAFYNSGSLMAITRLSDSHLVDVNRAFCEKLGFDRQDVIGKTYLELDIFENPSARDHILERLKTTPSIHGKETRIKAKNGSIFTGLFNIDLFYLGNELCIMTSMNDISEHVLREERVTQNNAQLTKLVNQKVQEIGDAQLATISALSTMTESRDYDTGSHVERLKEGCRLLAEKLSTLPEYQDIITPEYIKTLQYASVIHDIGKVGIKDSILLKPGKLTEEEFAHIKTHPTIGANILKSIYKSYPNNKYIEMGIEIAEFHHERYDGTGYPSQLKGHEIPLSAQILAICDVYDALRSKRPYKEKMDHASSVKQIISESGTHFDPQLINHFLSIEKEFEALYDKWQD